MANQGFNDLQIRIDQIERLLLLDYEPGSADALFDICDTHGHILKSGTMQGPVTEVMLSDVHGEELILMVLDGETSTVRPIHFQKAA
jgi:hypothetical protein